MKASPWLPGRRDAASAIDVDPIVDAPRVDAVLSEIATILALHLAFALAVIGALECWTSS